ncbi:MAG: hypothetical protein JNM25_13295 [Planctomycetes bacterium]|nr:hypothetical protein [Planctomycetota bacterium]
MEERYWLRHPSLRGLLGPYRVAELRAALEAKTFPDDSYVLPDGGQDETALRASPNWRPVTDVLGLPRPPQPPQPPPPPPSPSELAHRRRQAVRRQSAYALPRSLIALAALLGIAVAFLTMLLGLLAIGRNTDVLTIVMGLGSFAWQVLVIVVVAALLQALFDVADCALRADGREPS